MKKAWTRPTLTPRGRVTPRAGHDPRGPDGLRYEKGEDPDPFAFVTALVRAHQEDADALVSEARRPRL